MNIEHNSRSVGEMPVKRNRAHRSGPEKADRGAEKQIHPLPQKSVLPHNV